MHCHPKKHQPQWWYPLFQQSTCNRQKENGVFTISFSSCTKCITSEDGSLIYFGVHVEPVITVQGHLKHWSFAVDKIKICSASGIFV